ncbi:MAG: nitrate- and nitrite sensing domain-containing protein [Magnetococcales bacterium]|nr:nitrate- and nitrite sensing domain-containing protein [Magnetococcales bacterium]
MNRSPSSFAKIRWFALLLPPLVVVMGYVWLHLFHEWQEWHHSERLAHLTNNVSILTDLVYELQKERDYSCALLANDGQSFQTELSQQRQQTDNSLQKLREYLATHSPFDHEDAVQHNSFDQTLQVLEELEEARQQVDAGPATGRLAIEQYTHYDQTLLARVGRLIMLIADADLINKFFILPTLLHISDNLGRERSLLTRVFAADRFGPGMYEQWYALRGEREAHMAILSTLSSGTHQEIVQALDEEATAAQLEPFRRLAMERHRQGGFQVDVQTWFVRSTRMIDLLHTLSGQLHEESKRFSIRRVKTAALQFWGQLGAGIVLLMAVAALARAAILTTRSRLLQAEVAERKQHEAELSKLHHALAQTPISVIITDLAGTIEYVNETSLQHTGYTREELLGQNVRIFKSGHTPSEEYATVWNTILAGRVWQGEFYNRKKDGSCFWEAASISPIRDPEGEIRHFLAIKEDITAKKWVEQDERYRHQILEQVAAGLPLPSLYPLVMEYLHTLSPGVTACISVLDRQQQQLYCVANSRADAAGSGRPACPASRGVAIQRGTTACAEASFHKRLFYLQNMGDDSRGSRLAASCCGGGLHSCWSMPVLGEGGEVLGALVGYYQQERLPDARFLERLAPLAQLVGIAIKRAWREEDLHAAAVEAAAANQAKGDFLANMSHEMRTPLHAIIGALELMSDSASATGEEECQLAYNSAQTLLFLINDMLDYSKIEAGQLHLESLPFALDRLLQEVMATMGFIARKKGVTLTHTVAAPADLSLRGDPNRLKQVLINLVGNAIKFTPEGGMVAVGVEGVELTASAAELVFEVRDSGIGIPVAQQQKIFERFTQADGSVTRRFGGTGLGLAICRDLVALMGGSIGVEENRLAPTGSRFYFNVALPRLSPSEIGFADAPTLPAQPSASVPPVATGLAAATILLVDDQQANLTISRSMLVKLGCRKEQIVCIEDGKGAVERFQRDRFDLVLMDCQMPVMDGYEACRRMRAWEQAEGRSPTPILAFTADVTKESRQQGESVGMSGFVSKPVTLEALRVMLERGLREP